MLKKYSIIWFWLIISLFATAIFVTIGRSSVWHDEGYTSLLVSYPAHEIVERTIADVHPPLYYLVLKGWIAVFGPTIISLRSMSALFMILAVATFGWYLRRKVPVQLAVAALAGMALSPFLIRYGQEARMYGLGAFFVVLMAIAFFEKMLGAKQKYWFFVYAFALAAALYTQYFLGLLLFGFALALYIYRGFELSNYRPSRVVPFIWSRDRWWFWATLLSGAIFLPWVPFAITQIVGVQGGFWIGPLSLATLPNAITQLVLLRPLADLREVWVLAASLVIAALISLGMTIYKKRADLPAPISLFPWVFLGPVMALILLSVPPLQPLFHPRYLIAASLFIYAFWGVLIFARGVMSDNLLTRLARVIILSALLLGIWQVWARGNNFDWPSANYFSMKTIAREIASQAQPGDTVLSSALWTYFDARHHLEVEENVAHGLHPYLYSSVKPVYGFGNWSAVYGRDDILIYSENLCTLGTVGHDLWLIDEQVNVINAIPSNWSKVSETSLGYAKLTRYIITDNANCVLVLRN